MHHKTLMTASLLACVGVLLGAFGAHGLRDQITPQMLATWNTAVTYQMWHALGLGLIALQGGQSATLVWSGRLMTAGIVLFSGSLYLLVLSDIRILGIITPFGGLSFIAAWALLAWHGYQHMKKPA